MDEATKCDRVALIQDGKILDIDTPERITEKFAYNMWAIRSEKMFQLLQDTQSLEEVISCYPFGQFHHVVLKKEFNVDQLKKTLKGMGHNDLQLKTGTVTIEDCFMELMRK